MHPIVCSPLATHAGCTTPTQASEPDSRRVWEGFGKLSPGHSVVQLINTGIRLGKFPGTQALQNFSVSNIPQTGPQIPHGVYINERNPRPTTWVERSSCFLSLFFLSYFLSDCSGFQVLVRIEAATMPFGILDCKKMEVVPGTGKRLLPSPSRHTPSPISPRSSSARQLQPAAPASVDAHTTHAPSAQTYTRGRPSARAFPQAHAAVWHTLT